jgi:hypothetical protein
MTANQTLFLAAVRSETFPLHSASTLMRTLDCAYTNQSCLEAILINGTFLPAMDEHMVDVTLSASKLPNTIKVSFKL